MPTVDPTVAAAAGDFWLLSWLTGSPILAIIGTVLTSLAGLVFLGFRMFKVLAPSLLASTLKESVLIAVINRPGPAGMRIA